MLLFGSAPPLISIPLLPSGEGDGEGVTGTVEGPTRVDRNEFRLTTMCVIGIGRPNAHAPARKLAMHPHPKSSPGGVGHFQPADCQNDTFTQKSTLIFISLTRPREYFWAA